MPSGTAELGSSFPFPYRKYTIIYMPSQMIGFIKCLILHQQKKAAPAEEKPFTKYSFFMRLLLPSFQYPEPFESVEEQYEDSCQSEDSFRMLG